MLLCFLPSVFLEENVADSNPGLLLVLIHASGKQIGRERRDAIRATWVSEIDLLSEEFEQRISYKYVRVCYCVLICCIMSVRCHYFPHLYKLAINCVQLCESVESIN